MWESPSIALALFCGVPPTVSQYALKKDEEEEGDLLEKCATLGPERPTVSTSVSPRTQLGDGDGTQTGDQMTLTGKEKRLWTWANLTKSSLRERVSARTV